VQKSIQAVLPDMEVSVQINLKPAATALDIPQREPIPDKLSKDIDLIALRNFLNAYAKQAGKTKALKIVQEYANGSKNPDDIPVESYNSLVKQIATDCPGLEISFNNEDPEAV